jgi:hypothetical protein
MLTYFEVNDKVTLTAKNLERIKSSNRSIICYPSDSYIKKIERFVGYEGVITHTFKPSFEVTVRFNDVGFHARSDFLTKLEE